MMNFDFCQECSYKNAEDGGHQAVTPRRRDWENREESLSLCTRS